MGVYLNRYFDLEVRQGWSKVGVENPIEMCVFKFCFGNSKRHRVGNVLNLEPTANFDSHISVKKPSETDHDLMKQMKHSQVYLYEYNEEEQFTTPDKADHMLF